MNNLQERKEELKALLFNLAIEKNKATDEKLRKTLEQAHQEVMDQLNKVRKEFEFVDEFED